MSLEKAKADLDKKGFLDHVIELADSTATVAEAAGGAWRRTGNDREDDVIFTGRRAGPGS